MKTKYLVIGFIALILVAGALATTTVRDTFFQIGNNLFTSGGISLDSGSSINISNNITMNNSGIYLGSTKSKLTKAYDVVVCRYDGTNHEVYQECDVVCDDGDCIVELNSSIQTSNTNVLWRAGYYPGLINGYGLITSKQNITIDAYNVILNVNQTGSDTSIFKIINTSNFNINGLQIVSNNTCDTNTCVGLFLDSGSNIHINNIKIKGVSGFQVYLISNLENLTNVYIKESIFESNGINDAIGGGIYTSGTFVKDIFIENNKIVQKLTIGNYTQAIDIVAGNNINILNNVVYGNLVFGTENNMTTFSSMINNIVYPAINDAYTANRGDIKIDRKDSKLNKIINNNIIWGIINFHGNDSLISGNTISFNSDSLISINGSSNIIISNNINGGNRGISLFEGKNNLVSNNYFYNNSFGSNPISILLESGVKDNFISNNMLINPSDATIQNGIYFGCGINNSIADSNKMYNYGVITANYINFGCTGTNNNSISNNYFIGNNPGVTMYTIGANNYADVKNYTTLPSCNNNVEGKSLWNTTDGTDYQLSVCKGGTWY